MQTDKSYDTVGIGPLYVYGCDRLKEILIPIRHDSLCTGVFPLGTRTAKVDELVSLNLLLRKKAYSLITE